MSAIFKKLHATSRLVEGNDLLRDRSAEEDLTAGLVHLQLSNDDVRGVNSHKDSLSIGLIPSALLDVNHVLLSVYSLHLAGDPLETATDDLHLVIATDRDCVHLPLVLEIGSEGGGHALTALDGGSPEVRLALLSSR